MPEGIETSRTPGPGSSEQDVHDALADLFISDSFASVQAASQPPPQNTAPIGVELVIPGHLPVRGSVWIRQFASAVATEKRGAVALLRAADGTLIAERVEPSAGSHAISGTAQTTGDIIRGSSAVLAVASEVDAFGLLSNSKVTSITVLSAANDAAVVHAYQILKTLAFRLDELRGVQDAGSPAVTLGLAVVGESSDRQAAAFQRVRRAVRSFLDRELIHRPGCERCDPVRSSARVEAVAPASAMLDIATRQRSVEAAPLPQPTPAEAGGERHEEAQSPAPAALPHHHRRQASQAGDPSASAFPASLSPVGFHCPDAPEVTLGIDPDGRLHGVIRGRNISALLSARRWARRNARLLALAEPRLAGWAETADLTGHAVYGEHAGTGTLIVTGERGHKIRELRPVMIADDDQGA